MLNWLRRGDAPGLEVVESVAVDGKRQLILLRRTITNILLWLVVETTS
jgi:hypothetical protein